MEIVSTSLEETAAFAQRFLESLLKEQKNNTATVVGLYGDLGAGKTAFTKCVAKILGVDQEITSPTFVIEKIYKLPQKTNTFFEQLIHIDAYRLEKGEELAKLGWSEIIANPKNLILLEWPEKVAEVMPKDHKKLFFTFVDENTRKIREE